jgi:hypothetical protein
MNYFKHRGDIHEMLAGIGNPLAFSVRIHSLYFLISIENISCSNNINNEHNNIRTFTRILPFQASI